MAEETATPRHEQEGASTRRLGLVTAVNAAGFGIELAGGVLFGSVALLGDAVHMLFDAIAYATAFLTAYTAERLEGADRYTYGLHRLEVFSALLNGLLLIPLAGGIVWAAYSRFLAPVEIAVAPTLLVASGGLLVNLLSVHYLEGASLSLNERGALYHLLGDTAGSLLVILGTVLVAVTGIRVIDPLAAVLIAGLVAWSAGRVLLEGTGIMLQRSPVDPAAIRDAVASVDGVQNAHGINAWRVCSSINVCTVHAALTVTTLADAEKVRHRIEDLLHDRFDLQHVTVQVEQKQEE